MKVEIVGSVERANDDSFDVPIIMDTGMHARAITAPVLVSDLVPRCSDYSATMERPYRIPLGKSLWVFRGKVVSIEADLSLTDEERALEVMHVVARRDRRYERLRRILRSYEDMSRTEIARRETIPEDVRIFVWQRDCGKCVKCGADKLLEFDHIIPVSKGGSNTARNIQLLCEQCNREKSAHI